MDTVAKSLETSTRRPIVGVVQLTSTGDTARNIEHAEAYNRLLFTEADTHHLTPSGTDKFKAIVQQAQSLGVVLLCFPECFAFMGETSDGSLLHARKLDSSPVLEKYKQLAKTYNLWFSLGGLHELSETEGKIHNTHLIVDNSGNIRSIYRKVHMFRVAIEGGPNLDETRTTIPGNELVVVDTPVGRLGLSTCYDLRFPDVYTKLRNAGAEILLVPSDKTGQAHWEPLLRARAIENQCYVLAAAQYGKHNNFRTTHGHSCIIDPWGTVVAQCADKSPTLAICEIDKPYLEKVRKSLPCFHHREDIIYSKDVVVCTNYKDESGL